MLFTWELVWSQLITPAYNSVCQKNLETNLEFFFLKNCQLHDLRKCRHARAVMTITVAAPKTICIQNRHLEVTCEKIQLKWEATAKIHV